MQSLKAVESSKAIQTAVKDWRAAFVAMGPEAHAYSENMLWLPDLGIFLQVSGWKRAQGYRHWNGLGNKPGSSETRGLVVEINPPDGGLPGRWQGMIAKSEDGKRWLLHRGEMNVAGQRIHIEERLAEAAAERVEVVFSDGSKRFYFPVACLEDEPLAIVLDTKRYMDLCVQVRAGILDDGEESSEIQKKAHEFEEKIGTTYIPPKGAKENRSRSRAHLACAQSGP